jgi:hypothetical protein
MFVVPANGYASIDSRKNPALRKDTMPYWCLLIFILQIAIMYFFAAIAKLYPDWVDGTYIKVMLNNRGTQWMGSLRNNTTLHVIIAICGFLFDLLIVPMLFFKRTRPVATIAAVCFHLFNSVTLKIGIFPYLSLSFLLFFYPQETVRRLFFPKKPVSIDIGNIEPEKKDTGFIKYILIPYFIIQMFLPLRHYFIKGDVLWTEEGYRLSWMMMLKSKLGSIDFTIRDKQTGKKIDYNPEQLLTKNQIFSLKGRPDMIWQVAQLIKEDFAKKGKDVAVFVEAKVGLNGHTQRLIIDPRVDLASAKFSYFGHDEWVLTYDRELLFK